MKTQQPAQNEGKLKSLFNQTISRLSNSQDGDRQIKIEILQKAYRQKKLIIINDGRRLVYQHTNGQLVRIKTFLRQAIIEKEEERIKKASEGIAQDIRARQNPTSAFTRKSVDAAQFITQVLAAGSFLPTQGIKAEIVSNINNAGNAKQMQQKETAVVKMEQYQQAHQPSNEQTSTFATMTNAAGGLVRRAFDAAKYIYDKTYVGLPVAHATTQYTESSDAQLAIECRTIDPGTYSHFGNNKPDYCTIDQEDVAQRANKEYIQELQDDGIKIISNITELRESLSNGTGTFAINAHNDDIFSCNNNNNSSDINLSLARVVDQIDVVNDLDEKPEFILQTHDNQKDSQYQNGFGVTLYKGDKILVASENNNDNGRPHTSFLDMERLKVFLKNREYAELLATRLSDFLNANIDVNSLQAFCFFNEIGGNNICPAERINILDEDNDYQILQGTIEGQTYTVTLANVLSAFVNNFQNRYQEFITVGSPEFNKFASTYRSQQQSSSFRIIGCELKDGQRQIINNEQDEIIENITLASTQDNSIGSSIRHWRQIIQDAVHQCNNRTVSPENSLSTTTAASSTATPRPTETTKEATTSPDQSFTSDLVFSNSATATIASATKTISDVIEIITSTDTETSSQSISLAFNTLSKTFSQLSRTFSLSASASASATPSRSQPSASQTQLASASATGSRNQPSASQTVAGTDTITLSQSLSQTFDELSSTFSKLSQTFSSSSSQSLSKRNQTNTLSATRTISLGTKTRYDTRTASLSNKMSRTKSQNTRTGSETQIGSKSVGRTLSETASELAIASRSFSQSFTESSTSNSSNSNSYTPTTSITQLATSTLSNTESLTQSLIKILTLTGEALSTSITQSYSQSGTTTPMLTSTNTADKGITVSNIHNTSNDGDHTNYHLLPLLVLLTLPICCAAIYCRKKYMQNKQRVHNAAREVNYIIGIEPDPRGIQVQDVLELNTVNMHISDTPISIAEGDKVSTPPYAPKALIQQPNDNPLHATNPLNPPSFSLGHY